MMNYRKALSAVFIAGLLCSGTSFFAQYIMKLNPCPLCILQRVAVIAVTLVSLIVLILPVYKKEGRIVAAGLVSVPALWGFGTAAYQIWLQSLPAMERPSCGAPWTFRLKNWPLFDVWEPVVRGFGDCGIQEYVMGIPLPVWSIMFFGSVLVWVWFALKLSK